MTDVAPRLRAALGLAHPGPVEVSRADELATEHYTRERLEYHGLESDPISAFLFTPRGTDPVGGVVIFHQHAGEWHLGKSEVAGLAGAPLQAFGPALAARGVAVLAPDAITFEERRSSPGTGIEPSPDEDDDWLQHYNGSAYRLVTGDTLMRKGLDDAQRAVSVLLQESRVAPHRVGVGGHSYGGTTALYTAAVDARCRFACISGALCSLEARMRRGTGINLFELVPGIASWLTYSDLLQAIAPRPTFVVSATQDRYAQDADEVVARAGVHTVTELRVQGDHALDPPRHNAIVDWLAAHARE
ncbi:MAG: hypothetical protein Rubg2KO_31280 [Rubricoccaceae bacterium]